MKIIESLKKIGLVKILFFASFFALFLAYLSQYFFGLKPCILCLYQRVPFFLILLTTGFCFIFKSKKLQKIALILAVLFLTINFGIAIFHIGVENGIFQMMQKCTQNIGDFSSTKELANFLKEQNLGRCDSPEFFFLGLSMAAWNVIFCGFLLGICGVFIRKKCY